MNLRVLSIIVVLFCCAFPTDIYSEPTQPVSAMGLMRCVQGVCDETEFQTKALFNLDVQKSKVLKLGKSRLETKSAFVTYTNEFFEGRDERLEGSVFHPADHGGSSR